LSSKAAIVFVSAVLSIETEAAAVAMADADQHKSLAFYVKKIRQGEAASWEKVPQQLST
jgi:hypothetical protein